MQGQNTNNLSMAGEIKQAIRELAVQPIVWARVSIVPQLTGYALNALGRQRHGQYRASTGAAWLMDCAHEIQHTIKDMQACPSIRLPVLRAGEFAGSPRIYALMALCAIFYEGKVDTRVMRQALSDFQSHQELFIREVEQATRCMQWVLLDLVGKTALAMIDRMQTCEGAHKAARQLYKKRIADEPIRFAAMAGRTAYAAQIQRSLAHGGSKEFLRISTIASQALHQTPMETNRADRYQELLRQREIKNVLDSLNAMNVTDDSAAFLSTHPAVAILEGQDAYTALDDGSQAHMRAFVARMAHKASAQESDVVKTALRLCGNTDKTPCIAILWEANEPLYTALGVRFLNRRQWMRRLAVLIKWIIPAALSAAYLFTAIVNRAVFLEVLGGVLFGYTVEFACTRRIFAMILPWLTPPRRLPRLRDVPRNARTVVAIPALVETREMMDALFWRLQVQAQAFPQAQQMILCCDFPQSGRKENALEKELTAYGASCARRLNKAQGNRFAFVTRARSFVRKEGKWMGREGLRGALMALNLALMGNGDAASAYGASLCTDAHYVLVIEEGAMLPSGEARRLLCTMAHPYNAAYALMIPRLVTQSSALEQTPLARLYAREGLVCARNTVHAPTMDVHGFGIFEGVGLYDVRRFTQAVRHLPPHRLLSYRFVEGALANSALVSDVQAVCAFANRYSAYIERMHRHIRGAWQWLPLLLGRMRDERGLRIKLPLPQRAYMAERILMTIVTLSVTQLLAISTFSVLPFWLYFALAFLPYTCPLLMCVTGMVSFLWTNELAQAYRQRIWCNLYRLVADLALCPYDAGISVDAAVRALYRMAISKKKLLEWLTKQQARRGDAFTLGGYSWHMLPALLFNLFMVLFACINKPQIVWPILAVTIFWGLSPLVARSMDRHTLSKYAIHTSFWTRLAKQTFSYFRAISLPDAAYLPPHGVHMQQGRADGYTTPTDIGMAILAPVCAKELGLLPLDESVAAIARLLDAADALPRWKGHPYGRHWLYCPEQTPVRDVCAMDSAMFALSLMVCQQALSDWDEPALAAKAAALWQSMDFGALYCTDRKLFASGYDEKNGCLTKTCHDLYAHRARMLSYVAVGCNQVDAAHLGALRHEFVKRGLFAKPLNEDGAMDAYVWPALFFVAPAYAHEGRLMYCAASQQRKRSRRKRRPLAMAMTECMSDAKNEPAGDTRGMSRHQRAKETDMAAAYAAALLAAFDENESYDILCEMERYGMRGNLGFFDALWYGEDGAGYPSMEYNTAHQGCVLVAATNVVTGGRIAQWAARSVPIAAVLPWFECCRWTRTC